MSNPTVIIADDDSDLIQALAMRCQKMGLDVFRSPDSMHALLGTHRLKPDLLVLDINMPGGNGLSVCEMLASDESVSDTPVIIMTGESGEEVVERCKSVGAHYVFKSPQLWNDLQKLICQILGMTPPQIEAVPKATALEASPPNDDPTPTSRPKVLCIDDDPDISHVIKLRLERYGLDVVRAFSGMQGFWSALDYQPQIIICDLNMPDGEGNYVFGRLREHPLTKDIPVIILTGQSNPSLKRIMFSLGVSAYLQKPLVLAELIGTLRKYIPLTENAVQQLS